jgi:hypothetical protein
MRVFSRKIIVVFLLWTIHVPLQGEESHNFISYDFSGGRFGDNLLAYLHAKWVSYKNQVPLLYKPFPYSSQLVLHDKEVNASSMNLSSFNVLDLMNEKEIIFSSPGHPKIYICPYFPECQWERKNLMGPHGKPWVYFDVDWKDPDFNRLLKDLIRPKQSYQLTIPPKETINIALHIREGGTYDWGDFALHFITKFPPFDFYIDGLLKVIELFPDKPLYCYLFTDALCPSELVEKIQAEIPPGISITFDCRTENNIHNRNVLEDFFSLFYFDVLIHPQSNFSLIPSLIQDYAVVYAPVFGSREGKNIKIDQVKFEINEQRCQELLK